jgi:RHS repeat-associated protein
MKISIKPPRMFKTLIIIAAIASPAIQLQSANRSACPGTAIDTNHIKAMTLTLPNSVNCGGSGVSGLIETTYTIPGCRGCLSTVHLDVLGAVEIARVGGSGYQTAPEYFGVQVGTPGGSVVQEEGWLSGNPNLGVPCGSTNIAFGDGFPVHGGDQIVLFYYASDGSNHIGLSASITNAYLVGGVVDDAGDIIFDVSSLPADGVSRAHAKVTNPNAFPANLLTWQIDGTNDEQTLGCTMNPATGEIIAGKIPGKITVRAYCSDMTNCWIEEDLKVGCGTCLTGCTDGSVDVGSVLISINAGNTAFGDSAGLFQINQAYPSTALATPAVLKYYTGGLTTNDVTVVRSNGIISKVIAPQISAGVVSNSAYQYQITFYTNSTLTGTPATIWTIQNPDGAGASNRLSVFQATGGLTNEYDYVWSGALNRWSLTTEGGAKVEQRNNATNGVLRTETHLILDGSSNIKFQETNIYQTFSWGEQQIQNTVGSGTNTLVTTWTYYTNSADTTNYGRLYQTVTPGNHWERYAYNTNGQVIRKVTQFLDATIPTSTAQENTNRLTVYSYYTFTGSGNYQLAELYTSNALAETSGTWMFSHANEVDTYRELYPGALYNGNLNLLLFSSTLTYVTPPYVGLPMAARAEDGTWTYYSYSTSSDGKFRTNTVSTGQAQADSSSSYIVDGNLTMTVLNQGGNQISQQTYDVASNLLTSAATTLATDTRGRPTLLQYLDGTTETTVYGCCGISSFTDREAITTSYTYDPYTKQVIDITRAAITTQSTFDAAGNLMQTTRIGTDNSQIVQNASTFDTARRQTSSTPASNGSGLNQTITNWDYFDGSNHHIKTASYPDGGTRIETYYQDGALLSVTGTGVHPLQYAYGMDAGEEYTREIKLGANGETTEFSQAYKDLVGRNYYALYSVASGTYPYTESFFNLSGQLVAQVDRDGVGTFFAYNGRAQVQDTAIDMNQNSAIDCGGTDRVTRATSDVTTDYGTTVLRTRTYVWATNNSYSSNLVSTVERSADGLSTWSIVWNNGVGVTNKSVTVYAGSGNRYVTNTAADGSYTLTYFQNDLLMSSTSKDAGSNQISQTTYGYDPHGRPITVADARTGTTTYYFNNADQVSGVVTPAPGSGQSAQATTNYFESMGRIWKTTLPDNTSVTNEFYLTGDLKRDYGSRAYPSGYGYDSQGRVKTMTNWSSFASGAGARVTTWNYDAYTGFMTNKVYNGSTAGPIYTYTGSGKLQTRLWARGTNTTYNYNNAGDLATVTYNDGSTPSVTYGYDRRGRQISITSSTNVCSLIYDDAGDLLSESYSAGLLGGLAVTNVFDSYLRRATNGLFNGSAWLAQARYTYDAASRLQTVGDGTNYAKYVYLANSPLVSQISFTNNGVLRMTTSKYYDNLNRLTQVSSAPSASSAVSFCYAYNSANQRTGFTNADNSKWAFGYDPIGQVTSGKKYWSDGTYVAGEQFTYAFDDIGNRSSTSRGGDQTGSNLRSASYYANALNQYTNRTVPAYVDILGSANSNANVMVESGWGTAPLQTWYGLAYRKGEFFRAESSLDNSGGAVWLAVTNIAVLPGGTTVDIQTNVTGGVFVPKTPEQFSYDADGNLATDGLWTYTWDAENRLVKFVANLAGVPLKTIKFEYDWQGRRIHKQVWNNATGSGSPTNDVKFVYDGWNPVAQLSTSNAVLQTYIWGLDLSGGMQGAGGVGGLLAVKDAAQGGHFAAFDGNGNVAALAKAADGTVSANYEYGPFGEVIRASGTMAKVNPLRSSTKYQDDETDMLYYGFRYYNPSTGRWTSRDSLGEAGGLNVQSFVWNAPQQFIDGDGLQILLSSPLETVTEFGAEFGVGDSVVRVGPGPTTTGNSMGPGSIIRFGFRGQGLQPPVPIMPNPQLGNDPQNQPQPSPAPAPKARSPSDNRPPQAYLYRAMIADKDGIGPLVGQSARTLGLRRKADDREGDVEVGLLDIVGPKNSRGRYQGLSVAPDRPNNLFFLRRPRQLLGPLRGGGMGPGSGKDPVWKIPHNQVPGLLDFYQDSPIHGVIYTKYCVKFDDFERMIEQTKLLWLPTDLTPFLPQSQ